MNTKSSKLLTFNKVRQRLLHRVKRPGEKPRLEKFYWHEEVTGSKGKAYGQIFWLTNIYYRSPKIIECEFDGLKFKRGGEVEEQRGHHMILRLGWTNFWIGTRKMHSFEEIGHHVEMWLSSNRPKSPPKDSQRIHFTPSIGMNNKIFRRIREFITSRPEYLHERPYQNRYRGMYPDEFDIF